jgi:hypothetical protein
MGEVRNAYRVLVGKPDGQTPIGKSKHRCKDNIKMGIKEIGWEGRDSIHLA